jgi:spore maturation protein CgeB
MTRPGVAFFGSSLVSSYWNGAATYYRGIIRALAARGWRITFFEPDAYDRQLHRDMPDPPWSRVVVYPSNGESGVRSALDEARAFDVIVKASGVGVFDELLEEAVVENRRRDQLCIYWDVDAPATLDRLWAHPGDPLISLIPKYDLVLTYGGGPPIVRGFEALGARACIPIYNAVDPATHYPVARQPRFLGDLALLANRLPDRERRIEQFFLEPATRLPAHRFLLGGNGWDTKPLPPNVNALGHVGTEDHNALNCSPLAVLSVNRESMARIGFSPATRVFEAAGAGACLISDVWEGLDMFLEPETEVLVVSDGDAVVEVLSGLEPSTARAIGAAARRRVLGEHTYEHRADLLESVLGVAQVR